VGPGQDPAGVQHLRGTASLRLPLLLRISIGPPEPGTTGSKWWDRQASAIRTTIEASISPYLPFPPKPTPTPTPSIRGKQEEPVIDAGGGGVDSTSFSDGAHPPVLEAPVVVAPVAPVAPIAPPIRPAAPPAGPPAGWLPPRPPGSQPPGGSTPVAPRSVRPSQEPTPPTNTFSPLSGYAAPRQGYNEYLRTARLPEMAAAALPGVTGILLLTLGGSVIGYRQANSGRFVRTGPGARYLE
jgi:hypothetical protein